MPDQGLTLFFVAADQGCFLFQFLLCNKPWQSLVALNTSIYLHWSHNLGTARRCGLCLPHVQWARVTQMTALSWGIQDGLVFSETLLRMAFNWTAWTFYMGREFGKGGQDDCTRAFESFGVLSYVLIFILKQVRWLSLECTQRHEHWWGWCHCMGLSPKTSIVP